MKKLLDKTKVAISNSTFQIPTTASGSTGTHRANFPHPTQLELLRYRSHHGVNLGSIFVLEKWLYPSMFEPKAKGDSELEAVSADRSIGELGIEGTRLRWEQHWASALLDDEIDWLAHTACITSLRLPIGYFTLGAGFTSGTPFAGHVSQVYKNGWEAVLRLCERLYAVGIGVLLDLHALPGNANTEEHGGVSTHKAELWGNKANLTLARKCLVFLAGEVAKGSVRGCVGIQLCNEACWGAEGMYQWYESCIREIEKVDTTIPLYVSEAWDLGPAMEWSAMMNRRSVQKCPIGVATSRYFTFTEQDKLQSPQHIIERAKSDLDDVAAVSRSVVDNGAVQVVVAEWSCCMSEDSWAKANGSDKTDLVKRFGKVQRDQWRRRAGGAFFWTAKMQWMDGGEWGVFEMVKKGALTPARNLTLSFDDVKVTAERVRRQRLDRKKTSVDAHVGYWASTAPSTVSEHWRFEEGWDLGFADALAFFKSRSCGQVIGARKGADIIGCLEFWIAKRLSESMQTGGFKWLWEHGFRQGVRAFEACVLDVVCE